MDGRLIFLHLWASTKTCSGDGLGNARRLLVSGRNVQGVDQANPVGISRAYEGVLDDEGA